MLWQAAGRFWSQLEQAQDSPLPTGDGLSQQEMALQLPLALTKSCQVNPVHPHMPISIPVSISATTEKLLQLFYKLPVDDKVNGFDGFDFSFILCVCKTKRGREKQSCLHFF